MKNYNSKKIQQHKLDVRRRPLKGGFQVDPDKISMKVRHSSCFWMSKIHNTLLNSLFTTMFRVN